MRANRYEAPFRVTPAYANRKLLQASIASALAAGMLVTAPVDARTTRIDILSRGIAFGGHSFAGVGQYEKIVGIAYGEIDPNDRRNAVITDVELAPRNARGNVEYRHNFYILKPVDLAKGNHQVMYEPPNRGGKTYGSMNRSPGGNDPGGITDAAALDNSFLWPRGYTTVWSGWENRLANLATNPTTTTATADLPTVHNADGSSITGPGYEYIVTGGGSFGLYYPASSSDQSQAKLTHRVHLNDPPEEVPANGWAYTDATLTAIKLTTGNFVANDIYEFSYVAKDPTVNGMGFAAVRDFNSFLRYATVDDEGNPNPLAGDVTRIYTEISSQPGRMFNDYTHLGFNEDESGRKVIDGMMQWIAAGDGLNMNYRWSQTKRTNRNRQDLLYLEGRFPFANVETHDPLTGRTDSRYARCEATDTCPLAVEIYSANEYWVKAASLLHTDPTGSVDLPDSPYARNYFISSHQHGTGNGSFGNCQQRTNPLNSAPIQRALFLALDDWANGIAPPPSAVPRLSDGTMVPPLPQSGVGFPNIPGVTYTGLQTTRYLFNFGPNFEATGIPTINPPVLSAPYQDNPANGPIYQSYVPTTDSDGNDIAGVRLPDVTVPLATYTGWALRSGVWANDGCEGSGQYIPFEATKAERIAAGDPRPSVEERYKSFGQYRSAVVNAVDALVKRRLMLCEDTDDQVTRLIDAGLAAGVPTPTGDQPMYPKVPHCN
ncbi:MAG TPA: alpha/beta hydrolase domain-containing protein [Casimicrobiaceae bacterium]|nr:alpha/beta hydrolase domain-containing protein [Casimicrobiaceae bacterium]